MKKITFAFLFTIVFLSLSTFAQIPVKTLIEIVKAEDELRFDRTVENHIKSKNPRVGKRAALAAGRIGDEKAVPALVSVLKDPGDADLRAMAAFALGEIESAKAADAVLLVLKDSNISGSLKARAVEAAGKIAAANPKEAKSKELGEAILSALEAEERRGKAQDRDVILLGLTAILRARPDEGEFVAAKFLTHLDARVRADAANTLTRIRAKNSNEKLRAMLLSDDDPIARANAARALGAAEDTEAFELLLTAATTDEDSRVRVSAIRSLGSLKNAKAAGKLLERAEKLFAQYKTAKTKNTLGNPEEENELLVIASVLGTLLKNTANEKAVAFLSEFAEWNEYQAPEISVAFAQIAPKTFLERGTKIRTVSASAAANSKAVVTADWKTVRSAVQGLGALAEHENKDIKILAEKSLLRYLNPPAMFGKDFDADSIKLVIPDVLSEYAKFKTENSSEILRKHLGHEDVFIRTSAANLLGEQPAAKENIEALKTAFSASLETDKNYDDAQLAILSALVKLDKKESLESLRSALNAPNHLVRRRAADLIKQNDLTKDFSNIEKMVGSVKSYNAKTGTKLGQTFNSEADYRRAVSRKNGTVKAVLTTEKGKFAIEFLPEDAPLTVDNFIKLAKSGYFDGVTVHRVVPNFVMQDGDPVGNGSGGPGWSIRDEINMVPYARGAVGMALSGPHTGGSQWFVTHSPQPHLDGGYTVFGRVNETDMKIVDMIVRGDKILKVEIVEEKPKRKPAR